MKSLALKTLIICSALVVLSEAVAASNPSLAEKRQICFEKHGQLMEKPGLNNERDCYRVHGYLMNR